MSRKKDIMGRILSGSDEGADKRTRELDCLIYRTEIEDNEPVKKVSKKSWQVSKDNVSVEVWERQAKIRMKVSLGKNRHISMKRLASIAVDAILKELEKEE